MHNDSSSVLKRITNLRLRLGGEEHRGWLPPGAATPLPTPVQKVVVDLSIEFDGTGYLLICSAQDGSFSWDTWHESLNDAENQARDDYGVQSGDWIS
jgi:hypothetical protein